MAIVDRHGLPLSVSTHAANHHEVRLVQLCFDFYMIEAKPENLIGDRAYDSDPLDDELRRDGIEMIAPHRCNRSKPPTQDRRRLSRYLRRWLVERFFAWIQWQRRILVRWNTTPKTSSASSSSPASLSSSGDFEIGSSLHDRWTEWLSQSHRRCYETATFKSKIILIEFGSGVAAVAHPLIFYRP